MRSFARMLLVGSMVAVVAAGSGGAALTADPSPGPSAGADQAFLAGFETPEAAVQAYLAGVKDADLGQVLASSAVTELAARVDFVAWVDRIRAWMPFQAPAPATDPFLVGLTQAQQTAQLLGQTRMLVYGLLTDADLEGAPVMADGAWAETFQAQLDLSRLAGLTVGAIAPSDPEHMASDRYKEAMAKQAVVWGADEITERVAAVALEGREALVGFTLIRYGDAWKVLSQSSPMANLPVTGAPVFGE